MTSPAPCPYLPGKVERKVFTELSGAQAGELNEALGRIGFRRSQSVAYRPSCIDCQACVSVRVAASEFEPSATQRKLIRRHADLEVTACKPWTTEEQFDLLRRYLSVRHPGGGMAEMDENDFADMVEQTPVRTYVVEYREPLGPLGTIAHHLFVARTLERIFDFRREAVDRHLRRAA